jgi:hypothetical protein
LEHRLEEKTYPMIAASQRLILDPHPLHPQFAGELINPCIRKDGFPEGQPLAIHKTAELETIAE